MEFERLGYSISLDGDILLAAGIGPDSAGWLFAIESDTWEKIDSLYSSGIAVAGDRLYRLLCTSSHQNSEAKGELLVYDESGVVDYHRIDCLDDPHALICDGEYLVTPCPAVNTIFWLGFDGAVKRAWTAPGTADAWHVNSCLLYTSGTRTVTISIRNPQPLATSGQNFQTGDGAILRPLQA